MPKKQAMQLIEIQKGVRVGVEELLLGAAQMDTPALEVFADRLHHIIARRKSPQPSQREVALVSAIYENLAPQTQQRLDELREKLADERITDAEHEELLKLTQLAEAHNVAWLQALVELAQIRGVSPQKALQQLGLDKRFNG